MPPDNHLPTLLKQIPYGGVPPLFLRSVPAPWGEPVLPEQIQLLPVHSSKLSYLIFFFLLSLSFACENDELAMPASEPMPGDEIEVWSGPAISFTKANGTDPNEEANQDRITDLVWITRGNGGGQIFNAAVESAAAQGTSPAGTQWARGTTDDLDNLTFGTFRNTIRPQNVVGENLVLLLTDEQIAIDLTFTSWAQGRAGGFAYERSTR